MSKTLIFLTKAVGEEERFFLSLRWVQVIIETYLKLYAITVN